MAFIKVTYNPNASQALADGIMSLSKTGRIGLGKQFVEQYDVNTDSRADLQWDGERKSIAITFKTRISGSQKQDKHQVQIQPNEGYTVTLLNSVAGYIASSNFFKKINVDASEHAGRYRYEVLPSRDAGIADVDSEVFILYL